MRTGEPSKPAGCLLQALGAVALVVGFVLYAQAIAAGTGWGCSALLILAAVVLLWWGGTAARR